MRDAHDVMMILDPWICQVFLQIWIMIEIRLRNELPHQSLVMWSTRPNMGVLVVPKGLRSMKYDTVGKPVMYVVVSN